MSDLDLQFSFEPEDWPSPSTRGQEDVGEQARERGSLPRLFKIPQHSSRLISDAMERGSLSVVRMLLQNAEVMSGLKEAGLADFLAQASEWKEQAEAKEAVDGEGSALVRDHPFNCRFLPYLEQRLRARTEPQDFSAVT